MFSYHVFFDNIRETRACVPFPTRPALHQVLGRLHPPLPLPLPGARPGPGRGRIRRGGALLLLRGVADHAALLRSGQLDSAGGTSEFIYFFGKMSAGVTT